MDDDEKKKLMDEVKEFANAEHFIPILEKIIKNNDKLEAQLDTGCTSEFQPTCAYYLEAIKSREEITKMEKLTDDTMNKANDLADNYADQHREMEEQIETLRKALDIRTDEADKIIRDKIKQIEEEKGKVKAIADFVGVNYPGDIINEIKSEREWAEINLKEKKALEEKLRTFDTKDLLKYISDLEVKVKNLERILRVSEEVNDKEYPWKLMVYHNGKHDAIWLYTEKELQRLLDLHPQIKNPDKPEEKPPTLSQKDKDMIRADVFVKHIEGHLADEHVGRSGSRSLVICKICNKTIDEIFEEAGEKDEGEDFVIVGYEKKEDEHDGT